MSGITEFLGDNWQSLIGAGVGAYLSGQGQSSSTTPFMYPGQEELGGQFMANAAAEYNLGPQQFYPGQQVASLDPNTIAGQNSALGVTGVQQQLADVSSFGAMDLTSGGAGRIGPMQLPDQVGWGIPQGLENAVTNPIMRQLENKVLPGMDLAATSQGAFGGSRHQMLKGQAAADATGQMADSLARANLQARQQNIGQRQQDITAAIQGRGQEIQQNQVYNNAVGQGLRLLPQSINNLLAPSNTMQNVGQARTAYEQQLIDADKARFDFNQTSGYDALTRLGSRLSLSPPPGGLDYQQDAGWLDYLGGAQVGVGLVNSIFGEDDK